MAIQRKRSLTDQEPPWQKKIHQLQSQLQQEQQSTQQLIALNEQLNNELNELSSTEWVEENKLLKKQIVAKNHEIQSTKSHAAAEVAEAKTSAENEHRARLSVEKQWKAREAQLDREVAEKVAQELPEHIANERRSLRQQQQKLERQIKREDDLIARAKIGLTLTGVICALLIGTAGWHNHQAKKYASERRIALKAAQSAQKAAEGKTASQYTKQSSEHSQNAENASSGPSEQEIQAIKNEIKTAYDDSLATGDNAEARQAAVKAKQQQIIADYDKIKDHLNISDSFTYWMYVNQIKALS